MFEETTLPDTPVVAASFAHAGGGGTGALDHIAFFATGRVEWLDALKRHETPYRERVVPAMGLHQVFLEDPDGITIEMNFPASE